MEHRDRTVFKTLIVYRARNITDTPISYSFPDMSLISRLHIKGSRKGVRGRDNTGGKQGWWVGGGDRDRRGSPLGWVGGDVPRKNAPEKVQRNRIAGDIMKKYSIYIDLSRQ
jgi:hypothetical protein